MWQKSHPSIPCFFLGLIFFISGFNLTNLRAINSSFSFSPFIIISQSPKWKNTFKSCLGWNFFWVLGKPKKNLTFLTFYEILERTKEKEMLKHAKKKYNEKWWRIDKKTKTSLIPCVWNFLELLAVHKRTVQPCNFHPSFGTHKNPRIRAKSQKLLQMAWSSFWQREKRFFDYSHAIPNFSILHSPFIFNFSAP